MDISINLWDEIAGVAKQHLIAAGFTPTGAETSDQLLIALWNWKKRLISPGKRTVHKASGFTCPPAYKAALVNIEQMIANGQDLTPYLSKHINHLDFSDPMLNDWGVHHMHLGDFMEASGFIKRTNALLFARFSETDAYFIGIFEHGNWADQEIVEIIHGNWPKLIERYKAMNALRLTIVPTNEDIARLRKGNVNALLQLKDGTVYTPIGLGFATDGTAIEISLKLVKLRGGINAVEKTIREHASTNPLYAGQTSLEFHLEFQGDNAFAAEAATRVAYKLWDGATSPL